MRCSNESFSISLSRFAIKNLSFSRRRSDPRRTSLVNSVLFYSFTQQTLAICDSSHIIHFNTIPSSFMTFSFLCAPFAANTKTQLPFITVTYPFCIIILIKVSPYHERSYHANCTRSRLIPEVKLRRARSVVRCVSTCEALVLFVFHPGVEIVVFLKLDVFLFSPQKRRNLAGDILLV